MYKDQYVFLLSLLFLFTLIYSILVYSIKYTVKGQVLTNHQNAVKKSTHSSLNFQQHLLYQSNKAIKAIKSQINPKKGKKNTQSQEVKNVFSSKLLNF